MTLLYQEIIQRLYHQSQSIEEFQQRLDKLGYRIGVNLLELLNYRASVPVTTVNKALGSSSSGNVNISSPSNIAGSSMDENESGGKKLNEGGRGINVPSSEFNQLGRDISRMKRRDLKVVDILQFIHGSVWSYLFGHVSSDLVKAQGNDTEYRILDNEPQWTQFIATQNQLHYESCNYLLCGVIRGFLTEAGFPCSVTAHLQPTEQWPQRVVFLIQLSTQVAEREQLRYSTN